MQYQIIGPENLYKSNFMHTEQYVSVNIYVYTYMHVKTIREKRNHKFNRKQRRASGVKQRKG